MEPAWEDEQLMQRMLAIVLRVDDSLPWEGVPSASNGPVQLDEWLGEWLENATERELRHATTFICYLQEKYPQKNNLPPFNTASRGRWRAWAHSSMPSTARGIPSGRDRSPLLTSGVTRKVKLSEAEWERLLLVESLRFPSLADAALIQIHVGFDPTDVGCAGVARDGEKCEMLSANEYEDSATAVHRHKSLPRHPDRLLREIRESIQRLSDFSYEPAIGERPSSSGAITQRTRPAGSGLAGILRRHELRALEEEISGEKHYIRQLEEDHLRLEFDSPLRGGESSSSLLHLARQSVELPTRHNNFTSAAVHVDGGADASRSDQSEGDCDSDEGSLRDEVDQIAQRLAEIKQQLGERNPTKEDSSRSSTMEGNEAAAAAESKDEQQTAERGASSPSEASIPDEQLGGRDLSVIVEETDRQLEEGSRDNETHTAGKRSPIDGDDMRLDLSQLDSSPRVPRKKFEQPNFGATTDGAEVVDGGKEAWIELEVHPRPAQSQRSSAQREDRKEKLRPYPIWLRLLPRADGTSSFRLLQLPEESEDIEARRTTESARERFPSAHDNVEETRDSGFLEPHPAVEEQQVFACDLSKDQIDRLIHLSSS